MSELYRSHSEALRSMARRQLGDPVEADDVVAATFSLLMTIQGPHTGDPRASEVRPFVLGVGANLIRRFRRARARGREILQRYRAEAPTHGEDVERTVSQRELAARLAEAIQELPDDQRTALLLSALEEYSAADIAELCGVPEATVRTRLFHARRKLRGSLERLTRSRRTRLGAAVALVMLIVVLAGGPRAAAARFVSACSAVLKAIGLLPRTSVSPPPHLPSVGPSPPRPTGALTPPSGAPSSEAPAPPAHAPPVSAPTQAPQIAPADPSHALYLRAHRAQFVAHDYEAALEAWNAYLVHARGAELVLEARFNRAIALAQLARVDEARQALAPFALGRYGEYRRHAAERLLLALPSAALPP
jgi:RNA polymerase sigma-70 factor (ECF subfamily)